MPCIGAISFGLTLFKIGVTRLCCAKNAADLKRDPLRPYTVRRDQDDSFVAGVNSANDLIDNNISAFQILLV